MTISTLRTFMTLVVGLVLLTGTAVAQTAPRTVVVGTSATFKPYTYLDDNGQFAGYDIEVLKAVNKLLPQYKFEFTQLEFKNILLSLGTKKIDIGANQFEKNPDRAAKFLFSDETYTNFVLRITVAKNRKDTAEIKGIKDLEGKTVQTVAASNDAWVLSEYNKAHNNAIKLQFTSSVDGATTIKKVEDKTIDAFIAIKRVVADYNKTFGDRLITVGEPIATSFTYFIYRKEDTQLKADIDKALAQLKKDGSLAKLSIQILGGDYTVNE